MYTNHKHSVILRVVSVPIRREASKSPEALSLTIRAMSVPWKLELHCKWSKIVRQAGRQTETGALGPESISLNPETTLYDYSKSKRKPLWEREG